MESVKYIYNIFIKVVIAAIIGGVAIYTKIQINKHKNCDYSFRKNQIVKNIGFVIVVGAILTLCILQIGANFN